MDPYVYPQTSVLRNLRDIRDPNVLAEFEADITAQRLKQLENNPARGFFDARHLKALHAYIFQDLYVWAGEFRTVNIARGDQFYFAFANQIDSSVTELLGRLRDEKHLNGLTMEMFSGRAGYYLGELNAIHPFRDGNGRTQREFVRRLALENDYILDWSNVSSSQMREASRMSFQRGDNARMIELVHTALSRSRRSS